MIALQGAGGGFIKRYWLPRKLVGGIEDLEMDGVVDVCDGAV